MDVDRKATAYNALLGTDYITDEAVLLSSIDSRLARIEALLDEFSPLLDRLRKRGKLPPPPNNRKDK